MQNDHVLKVQLKYFTRMEITYTLQILLTVINVRVGIGVILQSMRRMPCAINVNRVILTTVQEEVLLSMFAKPARKDMYNQKNQWKSFHIFCAHLTTVE